MKICIYSAVGEKEQFNPVHYGLWIDTKRRVRRVLDRASWRILGSCDLRTWVYEDLEHSNVGDVAIRVAIQQILTRAIDEPVQFRSVQWGGLTDELIEELNSTFSMLVIGGSGFFHFDVKGVLSRRLVGDLDRLTRLTIPVVGTGVGVNVTGLGSKSMSEFAPTEESVRVIGEFARLSGLWGVRDSFSKKILGSIIGDGVIQVPDPALVIDCRVGPSSPQGSADPPVIGLNFAFHGIAVERRLSAQLPEYVRALEIIRSELGCRFKYFVHSDAERVIPGLLLDKGIEVEVVRGTPCEMVDHYRSLDLHLCQMLHSSILAVNAGTPVINYSYDVKSVAFFSDLGIPELCLPGDDFTAGGALEAVKAVYQRKFDYRARLEEARRVAKERMGSYEACLLEVLRERRVFDAAPSAED